MPLEKIALLPLPRVYVQHAHATYTEVFNWLAKKGSCQWPVTQTHSQFQARYDAGELLGIYARDWMIGSVIVAEETVPQHGEPYASTPRWWMHTLNVNRKCAGEGVGDIIVEQVVEHVRRQRGRELWVQCFDDPQFPGVMPDFFTSKQFREVSRTPVPQPSGSTLTMVLMVRFA